MARYLTMPDGKKHLVEEIRGEKDKPNKGLVDENSLRAKIPKQDKPTPSAAKSAPVESKGE